MARYGPGLALVEKTMARGWRWKVARDLVLYCDAQGAIQFSVAAIDAAERPAKPLRIWPAWMLDKLTSPLNVQVLANRGHDPRNFSRIFTGNAYPPASMLNILRRSR